MWNTFCKHLNKWLKPDEPSVWRFLAAGICLSPSHDFDASITDSHRWCCSRHRHTRILGEIRAGVEFLLKTRCAGAPFKDHPWRKSVVISGGLPPKKEQAEVWPCVCVCVCVRVCGQVDAGAQVRCGTGRALRQEAAAGDQVSAVPSSFLRQRHGQVMAVKGPGYALALLRSPFYNALMRPPYDGEGSDETQPLMSRREQPQPQPHPQEHPQSSLFQATVLAERRWMWIHSMKWAHAMPMAARL